jgi:hypothetical protein
MLPSNFKLFILRSQLISAIAWRREYRQMGVSFPSHRPTGSRGCRDPFGLIQKRENFTFSFSIK